MDTRLPSFRRALRLKPAGTSFGRDQGPDLFASLGRLGAAMVDFCFPRRCAGCERVWLKPHQGCWCDECYRNLPWLGSPLCTRCGRPFLDSPSSGDHLCGDCLLSEPPFDTARSAAHHSGVVRGSINQMKFGGRLHRVRPLAELLVKLIGEGTDKIDMIVPVPLHVRRLRQRGFNQAALLAKEAGCRLALPVGFDILARKFWTEPQTRLKRAERLLNVKDAFVVRKGAAIQGSSVLLVDDVYTTGTTVKECGKVLRAGGAASVHVATVSRALPDWKADPDAILARSSLNFHGVFDRSR
jgi:ComF family protein